MLEHLFQQKALKQTYSSCFTDFADMDDAGSFDLAAIIAVSSRSRLMSFGDADDAESGRMLIWRISESKNNCPNASGDATPIRNVFIAASVMTVRQK